MIFDYIHKINSIHNRHPIKLKLRFKQFNASSFIKNLTFIFIENLNSEC